METLSAHLCLIEDDKGDLVDVIVFCSDWCHRDYCNSHGMSYDGWNGCHEMDAPQQCANCEKKMGQDA